MSNPRKATQDTVALRNDALAKSARYLARFNELDERGDGKTKEAELALSRAQRWLDRANELDGND